MTATLADVLAGADDDLGPFHGFGGLHGGLVTALLLRESRRLAPDLTPVEISVHLVRPVGERPRIDAGVVRAGRTATVVSTSAATSRGPVASSVVVLAAAQRHRVAEVLPPPPADPIPVDRADRFVVPPEFVPISTRMEIRPMTPALPYSGSPEPRLSAWIRLTEPVEDPYEHLLVLADALAPSYAAILSVPQPIPTVRMTLRFSPDVATTAFDWVLIDAITTDAGRDGWLTEVVNLWTPDGVPLATSSQLRVVAG